MDRKVPLREFHGRNHQQPMMQSVLSVSHSLRHTRIGLRVVYPLEDVHLSRRAHSISVRGSVSAVAPHRPALTMLKAVQLLRGRSLIDHRGDGTAYG